MTELEKQINLVVEARAKAKEALINKTESYQSWLDSNQHLLDSESNAKATCQEVEAQLRELALVAFRVTGEKQVAPGIGIRVRAVLDYEPKEAMDWAIKHELALKLDASAFEKIAKTSKLLFVSITEEPTATIATELQRVE